MRDETLSKLYCLLCNKCSAVELVQSMSIELRPIKVSTFHNKLVKSLTFYDIDTFIEINIYICMYIYCVV